MLLILVSLPLLRNRRIQEANYRTQEHFRVSKTQPAILLQESNPFPRLPRDYLMLLSRSQLRLTLSSTILRRELINEDDKTCIFFATVPLFLLP